MNQHIQDYESEERHTVRWAYGLIALAILGLLYGIWSGHGGLVVFCVICGFFLVYLLRMHHEAKADEAAVMVALNKVGRPLSHGELVYMLVAEVSPGDVLPALVRLEERNLVYRFRDGYGELWSPLPF